MNQLNCEENEMKFKPILAPNDQPILDDIKYPILASVKLDGIRCIFYKGEMLTRSLKPIVNKQLREKFEAIAEYTKKYSIILDGEIYSHELTFQEITRYVMTQDFKDAKSIKKHGKVLSIPEHLKFNCFDCLKIEGQGEGKEAIITINTPFISRLQWACGVKDVFPQLMTVLKQDYIADEKEVTAYFEKVLADGYEGLILRDGEGKYKCGRCTIKEGNLYKVKPFRTFDGKIIEVTQGTEVINKEKDMLDRLVEDGFLDRYEHELNDEGVKLLYETKYGELRKINELGRTVTSKKKADRMLVDRVRDFVVQYDDGNTVKVSTSSLTHAERAKYWKIKDELIGQWIEYKGMLVGAKDVPRHPVFIRFREPKEDI